MTLYRKAQLDRIELLLAESKTRRKQREQYHRRLFIGTLTIAILFVLGCILMLAMSGIDIGHQELIYQAYKHNAIELETNESLAANVK